MRILSARAHGVLDYVTVALFAVAPSLFRLTGTAATLSYALAGIHLLMTLLTAFPLGVARLVPLTLHGWVELVVALALVLLGVVGFGLEQTAGLFYLLIGLVIFAVWFLSNYRSAEGAPGN